MKKFLWMFIGLMTAAAWISAHAATVGCIDVKKVFASYEKTKKAMDHFKKKEQALQDEVAKRQKILEKEKEKNTSDGDLKRMVETFNRELEPQRNELMETQNKAMLSIQDDITKATDKVAREKGLEVVLDKDAIITGAMDITDEVLRQLNKNP